jgi:hypothetical protein
METRSIAIGVVAIVAAFATAFGMAKSGQSKTETAGAGVKAQSIKVASPAAVAGVEVGGTLPALKAERKPAKKKKPTSTTNTSTPSASATPAATTPPSTTTQPTNPTPQPSNPTPQPRQTPQAEEPIQSGGDDG